MILRAPARRRYWICRRRCVQSVLAAGCGNCGAAFPAGVPVRITHDQARRPANKTLDQLHPPFVSRDFCRRLGFRNALSTPSGRLSFALPFFPLFFCLHCNAPLFRAVLESAAVPRPPGKLVAAAQILLRLLNPAGHADTRTNDIAFLTRNGGEQATLVAPQAGMAQG